MTPKEAEKYLKNHPLVEKFILGFRLEDGNLIFDAVGCTTDVDFKKEVSRFAFVRVFELKEIK